MAPPFESVMLTAQLHRREELAARTGDPMTLTISGPATPVALLHPRSSSEPPLLRSWPSARQPPAPADAWYVAEAEASRSLLLRRMRSSGGSSAASVVGGVGVSGSRDRDRAMHAAEGTYLGLFGVASKTAIACDDQRVNETLPLGLRASGDHGVMDVRQP